jgi:dipeptidyl aminopeptidase/acylaminoacyl peptidase
MRRDLREEPLFYEVERHFRRIHEPGLGRLHAVLDLAASPDGRSLAFTGSTYQELGGTPLTRIGLIDASARSMLRTTAGPNNDRTPRFSPDGTLLAFLSDRDALGRFRLYLEDATTHTLRAMPDVEETIESFAWAPDSPRILAQSAGLGADLSGAAGSGAHFSAESLPAWMPDVEEAIPEQMWRRLWLWDLQTQPRPVSADGVTVWEASWCGPAGALAIVSENPREGAWYSARLERIDIASGERRVLYTPQEQLGVPCASPSGRFAAVIEACCSDRTIVAGELVVIDCENGSVRRFTPGDTDVTQIAWRDDSTIFCIGVRGFETVAGHLDIRSGRFSEEWVSRESCGAWYPYAALLPSQSFAVALESYERYPCVVTVRDGNVAAVYDFANDGARYVREIAGRLEPVTWSARDGLEIQGYVAIPEGSGPHPLVVLVHGGPVWAFRNTWSMSYIFTPLLVSRGYAVLHPNPRGSAGRGQPYARLVRGDMLGEDTYDILRGVDHLVAAGVADPARVAVTGRSYGGMMSSWLVTQTPRFAAAIPMAPVTDNISQHFTSNIPEFDALFFGVSPFDSIDFLAKRSPVLQARNASTPTLNIAGARDRCTPPTQALEFHRALVEAGVPSELVIYPNEGHHVDNFESQVDLCTRMLAWLDRYAPVG